MVLPGDISSCPRRYRTGYIASSGSREMWRITGALSFSFIRIDAHAFVCLSNLRWTEHRQIRMCSACKVTYRQQMTLIPESFAEYTADCLAEIDKVEEWLAGEGFCETEYSLPRCQQDAVDSKATLTLEGPGLGVSRSFDLSGVGSRQTDETDFRPVSGKECRCSQPPRPCPCRENLWARRRRD